MSDIRGGAVMVNMIKKTTMNTTPSNFVMVGSYVVFANIWPLLAQTPLGASNEIQLTEQYWYAAEAGDGGCLSS